MLAGVPKSLYGQERVKGCAEVFIVEGPMDYPLLWQWGYPAEKAPAPARVFARLVDEAR